MEHHDPHLADIPAEFFSFETGQLFRHCIECDRNLLEDGCEYLIERAIRNYRGYRASDVIFDYAICMDCAQALHARLSRESLGRIQSYFSRNADLRAHLARTTPDELDRFTAQCLVKGKDRAECDEFQIYAHCRGNKLLLSNPPYMVCGQAIEELTELLSEATREELGGFFDKHFGPDPDLFASTPRKRRLVFI